MFVVLLTNRVHDARAKRPAKVIADVRADLADAAALAVTDYGDGMLAMPASFRADKAVDWNRPERHARRHVVKKKTSAKSSSTTKGKASASKSSSSKAKPGTSKTTTAKKTAR